jgi:hypothetical protein
MTRRAASRLAGFFFLFYIATGITSLVLSRKALGGAEGAAALASIAQHATALRLSSVLELLTFFDAVALAVGLFALTRHQDRDLAVLALCCRVGEGVLGAVASAKTMELVLLASADPASVLGTELLKTGGVFGNAGAICFAVGSTLFAYLFLRARSIPVWLAWVGLVGSLLLVVGLPLQMAGLHLGLVGYLIWIPVAIYEVVLGVWLLVKGVAEPQ